MSRMATCKWHGHQRPWLSCLRQAAMGRSSRIIVPASKVFVANQPRPRLRATSLRPEPLPAVDRREMPLETTNRGESALSTSSLPTEVNSSGPWPSLARSICCSPFPSRGRASLTFRKVNLLASNGNGEHSQSFAPRELEPPVHQRPSATAPSPPERYVDYAVTMHIIRILYLSTIYLLSYCIDLNIFKPTATFCESSLRNRGCGGRGHIITAPTPQGVTVYERGP